MRVISGTARGTSLMIPKHPDPTLRPTMELVKNAIFNTLAESIQDCIVLDLFAGIGSLGIEALSRGASHCTFVENHAGACNAIRNNLEKSHLSASSVVRADALKWLNRTAPSTAYHVIFADPPYAKQKEDRDFTPELLRSDALHHSLKPGGLFILEHLPHSTLALEGKWECLRQKKYGATAVSFLRPIQPAALPSADPFPTPQQ